MSYTVEQPIQYTPDPDKFGTLAGGKVWFGVPNGNPASNAPDRIQVYLARQGLSDLPIAQPIDIGPGGVWMYNGSPAQIKVLVPYCVQITNSLGVQEFYSPASGDEITKFNAIDASQAVQDAEIAKSVKTVATYADIATALASATIGQQISLVGHTVAGIGGGIFDVVSSTGLTANSGTIVINGGRAAVRRLESNPTPEMFGALNDGTPAQAAFNAVIAWAGQKGAIDYIGPYYLSGSVNLIPQQTHNGNGAYITFANNISGFVRTTNGFPGRVRFDDFTFLCATRTGKAFEIVNNTPFVQFNNCDFYGFSEPVRLSGSYCSTFKDCYFFGSLFGPTLINECHSSSFINCLSDANTYSGYCVNGNPVDGNIGTISVHNVNFYGCGGQNTEFGIWAENCYDLNIDGVYHEGNTKADLRLGVGDAGTYARACYSFVVKAWQTASPCALGRNIIIEHAVGGLLHGLSFNSGCSTTAPLVSADGFSDKLEIDYHRVSTITPTATAPFDFVSPERVVIKNDGRLLFPRGMTSAIRFGNLAQNPEAIYSGTVPSLGRPALVFESVGTNQDVIIKTTGIERHFDASNNLTFSVDNVNQSVTSRYKTIPTTDNTVSLGNASNRWSEVWAGNGTIQTSDGREKEQKTDIPDSWLEAWGKVNYSRFKFKDAVAKKGDSARWHVGLIAQEIEQAFKSEGLNAFAIGILCYDEWEAEFDHNVETGEKVEVLKAGNRYGIRYEQALALECAFLRKSLQINGKAK